MSGSVRRKADMGLLVVQLDQSGIAAPVRVEQEVARHCCLSPLLFRRIRRPAGIMVQRVENGQARSRTDNAGGFWNCNANKSRTDKVAVAVSQKTCRVRFCPGLSVLTIVEFRIGIAAETRDRV